MHTTVFELTKNEPPQRRAGLGGALASLRTLLSPRRALAALALVAAALSLGGQAAQAQQGPQLLGPLLLGPTPAQAAPSDQAASSDQVAPNNQAAPGNQAGALNQASLAEWAWYFPVYDPFGGRYTFAFGLFFGAGNYVQMVYLNDHVQVDGGFTREDRSTWDWVGKYAVYGSTLVVSGQGYRTDVSNWNPHHTGRWPIGGTFQFTYQFLSPTKLKLITPPSLYFDHIPHWGSRTIVVTRQ